MTYPAYGLTRQGFGIMRRSGQLQLTLQTGQLPLDTAFQLTVNDIARLPNWSSCPCMTTANIACAKPLLTGHQAHNDRTFPMPFNGADNSAIKRGYMHALSRGRNRKRCQPLRPKFRVHGADHRVKHCARHAPYRNASTMPFCALDQCRALHQAGLCP